MRYMLKKSFAGVCVLGFILSGVVGCSGMGTAMTAGRMGLNLKKKDSHLAITLDGRPAEQNKLKKATTGYSNWKIKEQVSTSPTLRFEIEEPEKFGRITMVAVSIHQQFESDYSHQAEYTVISNSNDPMSQMKPGVDYNLGSPGGFRVMDVSGNTVSGVTLKPGMKYKLTLTVKADHSESAQVEFVTN